MNNTPQAPRLEGGHHFDHRRLQDSTPYAGLLSNGRYTTLISNAGSGFSTFEGITLNFWNGDRIEDGDGFFFYLRDLDSGRFWSLGHQPVRQNAERYTTIFHPYAIEINCLNQDIEAHMRVCVPPGADLELRNCTLRNHAPRTKRIELTSFVEVVLNQQAAHMAHPAFSKLFVQTEWLPEHGALLATRRPRSPDESTALTVHWTINDSSLGKVQFETDRARFIGRGRTATNPAALHNDATLGGTAGNVLDPVFSLRRVIELPPHSQAEITFALGAAYNRKDAINLLSRYRDTGAVHLAFQQAVEYGHDHLERLGISTEQAQWYQRLAGALLYADPELRAGHEGMCEHRGQTSEFRNYDLGTDRPLVIVWLRETYWRERVKLFCRSQIYWQNLTLYSDLLFLIDERISTQRNEIQRLIESYRDKSASKAKPGNTLVLESEQLSSRELSIAHYTARAVIDARIPDLLQPHADPYTPPVHSPPRFKPASSPGADGAPLSNASLPEREQLLFDNGLGGFTPDGKEYVITISPAGPSLPPLPWANVIANEQFGTIVSERGSGFSWCLNSREHRLTPWYNDPICDPYGEAFYVRDEQTGVYWSPTPGPIVQDLSYTVRHGFGYTCYEHVSQSLDHHLCVFVPRHDPLKIVRMRLRNLGDSPRTLSFFSYQRLVIGVSMENSGRFIKTCFDDQTNTLIAWNTNLDKSSSRRVFATLIASESRGPITYTGDREGFIGRNGDPSRPAALCHQHTLDGRTGTGLDPCLGLQLPVTVQPGETLSCTLLFGEASDEAEVGALIRRYENETNLDEAFRQMRSFWHDIQSKIQVRTPLPAVDVMLNGWLAYQNLSCRIWGRSAFYQSGGAFGFRDQLQDAAALIHLLPELTREQILLHAAHQFTEGDVLHWWHPPDDQGIRTRFSDDLLWLPFVCAYYVSTTGDQAILDQQVRFISARALTEGEDEAFLMPEDSGQEADLYEHCCLALDRSLTEGAHGLPLMGTGDWNDGMNRVGRQGRGESVWLGFFIYHILGLFTPLCRTRGDQHRVDRYEAYRARLLNTLNDSGWDGAWYRRAYFDDGTPLGSVRNEECRIDALAQAWAVISGAAPPGRVQQAMDALEEHLVLQHEGIIRLLTPAFDQAPWDPGYIKGYVAGVRENGGQYTHAALWAVQALAEAGRYERAADLMNMISPVSHTRSARELAVYQVEPYVIAADIYGVVPHVGRGGWTWYTGSAGWMYRITLESLLGFHIKGGHTILLTPRIPPSWKGFSIDYRVDKTTEYKISVSLGSSGNGKVVSLTVDGEATEVIDGTAAIPLIRDGISHQVRVRVD